MKRTIRRSLLVTMISVVVVLMGAVVANADSYVADPGTWNGKTYTYVIPADAIGANVDICAVGTDSQIIKIFNGINIEPGTYNVDCSTAIEEAFKIGDVFQVNVFIGYQIGNDDYAVYDSNFLYKLDVEVNNSTAVTEDTACELELDSAYYIDQDEQDNYTLEELDWTEGEDYVILDNNLVIKKGDTSVVGTVIFNERKIRLGYLMPGELKLLFLKLKDGKVHSDDVYLFDIAEKYKSLEKEITREVQKKQEEAKEESIPLVADTIDCSIKVLSMKNFNNSSKQFMEELVNAMNEKGATGEAFLAKCELSDTMVFGTKSSVGVNTADNSDLALWIALIAIATVAAGAVALKRN